MYVSTFTSIYQPTSQPTIANHQCDRATQRPSFCHFLVEQKDYTHPNDNKQYDGLYVGTLPSLCWFVVYTCVYVILGAFKLKIQCYFIENWFFHQARTHTHTNIYIFLHILCIHIFICCIDMYIEEKRRDFSSQLLYKYTIFT